MLRHQPQVKASADALAVRVAPSARAAYFGCPPAFSLSFSPLLSFWARRV
jgi:hypothetical protein